MIGSTLAARIGVRAEKGATILVGERMMRTTLGMNTSDDTLESAGQIRKGIPQQNFMRRLTKLTHYASYVTL